jgi:alkylated DNA repair dioxygenase AlkB
LSAHVPIYKYPGFQYESTLQYVNLASMPFGNALVEQLEQRAAYKGVPLTINHVIGTHYVTGEDNIGFHSDKAEDIQADSPILMFSFGGRRELWFREVAGDDKSEKDEKDGKDDSGATSSAKKSGAATSTTEKNGGSENKIGTPAPATPAATSTAKKQAIVQKFVMEPGSLFVLGPETNRLLQHSIVPESDETRIDREKEPLQPRISLVARHISTVLSRRELRCRIDHSVRNKVARAAAKQRKAQVKEQAQEKEIAERHGAKGTGQKCKRQATSDKRE